MPSQTFTNSITAGSSAQPLNGSQFEFINDDAAVVIGMLAEATGILASVYAGPDLVMEEGPVPIGSANQIPVIPDHQIVGEYVGAGTRMKVNLRNTTGGTIAVKTLVKISPI